MFRVTIDLNEINFSNGDRYLSTIPQSVARNFFNLIDYKDHPTNHDGEHFVKIGQTEASTKERLFIKFGEHKLESIDTWPTLKYPSTGDDE